METDGAVEASAVGGNAFRSQFLVHPEKATLGHRFKRLTRESALLHQFVNLGTRMSALLPAIQGSYPTNNLQNVE